METRVNCFLDKDDIVSYMPSLNKDPLILRNYSWKNLFDLIGNDFGDHFDNYIVERDMEKLLWVKAFSSLGMRVNNVELKEGCTF